MSLRPGRRVGATTTQAGALWRQCVCGGGVCDPSVAGGIVAWVAERKDVLSGLFLMLTIGLMRGMPKDGRESSRLRFAPPRRGVESRSKAVSALAPDSRPSTMVCAVILRVGSDVQADAG